jgi:CrcB protein
MLARVLLVAAGGAVGSALRYLVAVAAGTWLSPAFPWGTLAVNLVGSFLIGLVQQLAVEAFVIGEETRLFLTTGVMGGLTTYSAFSYESVRLFETGTTWYGWVNVVVTTVACLGLCYLGLTAGRLVLAPR